MLSLVALPARCRTGFQAIVKVQDLREELISTALTSNAPILTRMSRVPWNFGGGPMIVRRLRRRQYDRWHRQVG